MRALSKYFVLFFFLAGLITASNASTGGFTMDAKLMAQTETNFWQAYYQKDNNALFEDLVKLFVIQFNLTQQQALIVAQPYAKAAAIFGSLPEDTPKETYNQEVLPILLEAYKALNEFYPLSNYQEAAQYDLAWWVERRNPKTASPAIVGHSMAKMYQAIYGDKDLNAFSRAAYLRAIAGQYRDFSHDHWGGTQQLDWRVVETNLTLVYEILQGAVGKQD